MAIWAPNCWEWAVTALAVHATGGIVVPINTRFKGREAAYVMETSQARLLFTVTDFLDTDYVALLTGAGLPPNWRRSWCCGERSCTTTRSPTSSAVLIRSTTQRLTPERRP